MSLLSHVLLTPKECDVVGIDLDDWEWHDGTGGFTAHVWLDGRDAEFHL